MSEDLRIVGSPASPFTRKVRVAALELGLEVQFVRESPLGADSRVPGLNPLGKIPVLLRADGTTLVDSPVIAQYLDSLAGPRSLIPPDGPPRYAVLEWEAIADGVTDAAVLIRFEQMRPPAERSAQWLERQRAKIERALAWMDTRLGARARCIGESLTLADIAAACALLYLEFRLPEGDWRARYGNLARLSAELERRPSFQATPVDA